MTRNIFAAAMVLALGCVWTLAPRVALALTAPIVIDFESIPGGAPSEGLAISNQFPGVTFELEGGGTPVLAEAGGFPTAFYGPPSSTEGDSLVTEQNVGNFFLADDGIINAPVRTLIIRFTEGVGSASGMLLDIDNNEVWNIQARGADDQVLETKTLNGQSPNAGDGVATSFFFSRASDDIRSLRLDQSGSNPNTGFAVDNLSASAADSTPVPVPLPSAVWSGLSLLAGLGAIKQIRRWTR